MATMHNDGEDQLIFVKGAPEVLLEKADLTNEEKTNWEKRGLELARKGQRVLGFGYKKYLQRRVNPRVIIRFNVCWSGRNY